MKSWELQAEACCALEEEVKVLSKELNDMLNNKIANTKSLSRLEKENRIIEKIRKIDDNLLDYIDEQLCLLLKHFHY